MQISRQSETELAQRLLEGSEQAFDEFVIAYRSKLFQYTYLMCGQREDAEEVAQETLMRVFQSLDQLRQPDHLKSWVFRIARNACLMKRRKSVFAPHLELSLDDLRPRRHDGTNGPQLEIADWSMLPDEVVLDAELRAALTRAVENLPDLYRAVFLLRDVEELTTEETSSVLDVSVDVVRTRLHRARLALRKELDQHLRSLERSPAV